MEGMEGRATRAEDTDTRELVRFYLLDHRTPLGQAIDVALLALNLVFVAAFVLETYPFADAYGGVLWTLEVGISFVFLGEYLLRLYGARNTVAEATNPYTVVDLVSILPTLAVVFVPWVSLATLDIRFLRSLRVFRFLRFYRFTQDEEFFFGTVSIARLRTMKLLLTVFTIFFVSASLFYNVEHGVNPAVENFGDAFYFVVVALTTVGFGDVVPVTREGRLVTLAAILAGVILIPWQVSKIVREWTYGEKVNVTCQSCGLEYHDPDAVHCKACGEIIYHEYDPRR